MPNWIKNLALLAVTLGVIVAADRALYRRLRQPLWESDPVLHYKHRPNAVSYWGREPDAKKIRIKSLGLYDDEFPVTKPSGELRGLIIGDSIVMGHRVTSAESFANRLEKVLAGSVPGYASYQVINAGVQGYSTFQYREVLERSLRFAPDFVVVCFCMNDVSEPYIVNRKYGGSGQDYHGVYQVSDAWLDWLVNRTGFGNLAVKIRGQMVRKRAIARYQIYGVKKMARGSRTEPVFIDAWRSALADLSAMYERCRAAGIPIALVICSHRFQIGEPALQEPQKILIEHAQSSGIPVLDLTAAIDSSVARGVAIDELFMDEDHYTVNGHIYVARALLEFHKVRGVVDPG